MLLFYVQKWRKLPGVKKQDLRHPNLNGVEKVGFICDEMKEIEMRKEKDEMLLKKIKKLEQQGTPISTISLILEYENATSNEEKNKEDK